MAYNGITGKAGHDFLDLDSYKARLEKGKIYRLKEYDPLQIPSYRGVVFETKSQPIMSEYNILEFERKKRLYLVSEVSTTFKKCLEMIENAPYKEAIKINDRGINDILEKAHAKAAEFVKKYGLDIVQHKDYSGYSLGPNTNEPSSDFWIKQYKPTIDELIVEYNKKQSSKNRDAYSAVARTLDYLKQNGRIKNHRIDSEDINIK